MALIAIGFNGIDSVLRDLPTPLEIKNNVIDAPYGNFATNIPGVFAAGDCR